VSARPSAFDVLVIGAGLAGVSAAIEALESGARVAIVSAGPASSHRAQGGIAAAIGADDSAELHAEDTMAAGHQAGDRKVVGDITRAAPVALEWLEQHGVRFDRAPDGRPALGLEGGHSRARIAHAGGDNSGRAIMAALERALDECSGSRLTAFQGARLERLLPDGEGVGAAQITMDRARLEIRARATVLATGGFAGLFPRTTNSPLTDGRGILEAHRAGACVADLDLVQLHPTVFAGPGRPFLITEALRGAGAAITGRNGERFLFEVDVRGELAPRDVVSRAISAYLGESGEPHAWLDARPLGAQRLKTLFPGFVERCRRRRLDPARDRVPVAPGAHYTMGGVVTDRLGRTSVPGLWAAGECARIGLHGHNRLASNSLLEAVVMGRRAGADAAAAPMGEPGRAQITRQSVGRVLEQLGISHGPEAAAELLRSDSGATPGAEAARQMALLVVESARASEMNRRRMP
jgi:L-aspartate oxidase